MEPIFQSKDAVFCVLHMALPPFQYYFMLLMTILHPYLAYKNLLTSKNLGLIRHIMKINSCVPDYLQQYTDYFGEIGCLREKHHIVVEK